MSRIAVENRLTPFGRVVMSLAAERGIPSRAALLRRLDEAGYEFASSRVGAWLYGRNQVDRSFPLAIVKALSLEEEERSRLAINFMLGQEAED